MDLLEANLAERVAREVPHWYTYPPKQAYRRVASATPLPDPEVAGVGSLYVHVPFCNYRCKFCSLFARIEKNADAASRYALAVEAESRTMLANLPDSSVEYVYFGGGTPTTLPRAVASRLVSAIRALPSIHPEAVWAVEFAPETATAANVRLWSDLGFSRASMGVQTFDDVDLRLMGRGHTSLQSKSALSRLAERFEEVNADLIVGFGQGDSGIIAELGEAVRWGATSLTLHPAVSHSKTPGERKRLPRATSLSNIESIRGEALSFLSSLGWTVADALTFTASQRGATLESLAVEGFSVGLGASARSTFANIHLANVDYVSRAGVREGIARYEIAATSGRPAAQSYVLLNAEEFVRRRIILSIDRGRVPGRYIDEAPEPLASRAREIMNSMVVAEDAVVRADGWTLTPKGTLGASLQAARFVSRAVSRSILQERS